MRAIFVSLVISHGQAEQPVLDYDRGLLTVWLSWRADHRPRRCNCCHARPRKDRGERLAQGETIRY